MGGFGWLLMDKALLARVERQAWFHRYPRGLPAALLIVGLAVTGLFVLFFEQANDDAEKLALQNEASEVASQIGAMGTENVAYLNAAASMFSLSEGVNEDDLQQYVADMSANYRKRGVLGIGWARWITAAEVPAFEERQSQILTQPVLKVFPAPSSPDADLAVITYLEPKTIQNMKVLGYDMYSETVRRAAMDEARITRAAAVSGRITLAQDAGHPERAGANVYVPVFDRSIETSVPGDLRLKGFVYSPVRISDMLKVAIDNTRHDFAYAAIYDGAPRPQSLLASFGAVYPGEDPSMQPVEFAGRRWTLEVQSLHASGLTLASQMVLGFGALISVLLSALAWFLTHRAAEDRRVLEWLTRQTAIRNSLTRELNHRVKNTLANVLSIVALTRGRSSDINEFADGLNGRIRALSATHDLLSEREWKDAPVAAVVESELAPYLDPADPHAVIEGPDVLLAPNEALSLGLALHELATNAAKYGALSVSTGCVSVNWTRPAEDRCVVTWSESGGPKVKQPSRRGFGLELIERIVSHELQSPVELKFEPDGVQCSITVPVRAAMEFALHKGLK